MAKFHGSVGFVDTVEVSPGVWREVAFERNYFGDKTRQYTKWEPQDAERNDNIVLMDHISIVADDFVREHLGVMRYVTIRGIRWKIVSITTSNYPRIDLILGGVWNGLTPTASDTP